MTLRQLPEIKALSRSEALSFDLRPDATERWDAAIRNAADETADNVVTIYDVIGEDFWSGGGFTAKRMSAALRTIGKREVSVHINSPGGDFFEGVAIYNMLREHPEKVTVKVMGLAASAASLIAMAGDKVLISRVGFLMVHNAWAIAIGNRHDMRAAADTLEPFDEAMAGVYSSRAGKDRKAAAKWMDDETWFNGERAVAEGLADELLEDGEVAEDSAKAEAMSGVHAMRRVDALMRKGGASRSQARDLIRTLSGSKPGAAPDGKPSAAELSAVADSLQRLKSSLSR